MIRTALLVFAGFFFVVAPCFGAAEAGVELNAVVGALEAPFKADTGQKSTTIADFQADFTQQSRIASLDRTQNGSGEVVFKFDRKEAGRVPRAKFRWEYKQPTVQEIVSDGKTIWVYLPENAQVIRSEIDPASQVRGNDPVTFLADLGNLSHDFAIDWGSPKNDDEGNYVLELTPRQPSNLIQRLVIVVDRKVVLRGRSSAKSDRRSEKSPVFPIRSTTVYDPNGNSTLIEFSDIRVNRGLSDQVFEFSPPEGVEVIRPNEAGMGF